MPVKLQKVLDFIFPARCAVCDEVLPFGTRDICKACKGKIRYLGKNVCFKCGKPVKEEQEYCHDCQTKPHEFTQGRAVFPYEYIRSSLYRFKYADRREFASFYAKTIAGQLAGQKGLWQPQALIPVPLHKRKQKERGYNQAQLVAEKLGKFWNLPVLEHLVLRTRYTRPMKTVGGTQRQNNLKKAFKLGTNDVKLKSIIIIDDIYTTGSTIDAVAKVCKEAGIRDIYFITVSIGYGL